MQLLVARGLGGNAATLSPARGRKEAKVHMPPSISPGRAPPQSISESLGLAWPIVVEAMSASRCYPFKYI